MTSSGWTFLFSLAFVFITSLLVIDYLRPILARILLVLCKSSDGTEFWIRCLKVLSVTGTLLLVLIFGHHSGDVPFVDVFRRTLALNCAGIFFSITLLSSSVWKFIREEQKKQAREAALARMREEPDNFKLSDFS